MIDLICFYSDVQLAVEIWRQNRERSGLHTFRTTTRIKNYASGGFLFRLETWSTLRCRYSILNQARTASTTILLFIMGHLCLIRWLIDSVATSLPGQWRHLWMKLCLFSKAMQPRALEDSRQRIPLPLEVSVLFKRQCCMMQLQTKGRVISVFKDKESWALPNLVS